MALLSVPILHVEGTASKQLSLANSVNVLTANEMSGYRTATIKEDALQKCRLPISDNVQSRVWMSHDLSVYSNSEYVYAIFPIAGALFWDKGVREIAKAQPLSTIFTILTHRLNTTAINKYFVRTHGRWLSMGAMLMRSPPCAIYAISRNSHMSLIWRPMPPPSLFTYLCLLESYRRFDSKDVSVAGGRSQGFGGFR